ncbi:hypothetical protein L6164_019713 [Bauhinia variegata]|uniref:Uncharacterized protein n=1 Tax=Bauhinia variegata TaxID=167791 RepID=A0ACB9MTH9_BAUVA|nr:hypothetical protein L6164_019713 [Bauhinia variegata]
MLHSSFFSQSCYLIFFFLITIAPLGTSCSTILSGISNDIIDQTCEKCANQSIILSYSLCSTSLQAIPVSHATNLQGLALIALELALQNATDTLSRIQVLLNSTDFDNFALACLKDCFQLYTDAAWTIAHSLGAFLSENYEITKTWTSGVMETAATCQEGFGEKKGGVSPLTKENYNLFQLCGIALCIIHMFTLAVPS